MDANVCPACKGTCVVENSQHVMQTCPVCNGDGLRRGSSKSLQPSVFPGVVAVEDEIKK